MTCKQTNQKPSEVWGMLDTAVAYAFDAAAATVLFIAESELENARLEAMAAANATAAFNANAPVGGSGTDVLVDGQYRGSYEPTEYI